MAEAEIGVIGLGVMGANLALNMAETGFRVAVFNRSSARTEALMTQAGDLRDRLRPTETLEGFVAALETPRSIVLMIKAGAAVDDQIAALRPLLAPDDRIIDAGNSDFHDTRRREHALAADGLRFIGMGVSGGEEGARHGPSIMVGGPRDGWPGLKPIIQGIAAKFEGDPCADWLGPDGAGHFVKMVHNGIEYGDMQLIAEVYGLLRDGAGRSPTEIGALFERWQTGPLSSYLVEVTAAALKATDRQTGRPAVDVIVDAAGQKGTGRWTVIEAQTQGVGATVIEAAVAARAWSAGRELRVAGAEALSAPGDPSDPPTDAELADALLAARIIAYAQGFEILQAGSEAYAWSLPMARIAEIWRAGCIIRSALLDDISAAYRNDAALANLILAPRFAETLRRTTPALRAVTAYAIRAGLPVPGFAAALMALESRRQARGTANLVQAQRDFFGAHGFERIDAEGTFHGPWSADASEKP